MKYKVTRNRLTGNSFLTNNRRKWLLVYQGIVKYIGLQWIIYLQIHILL